MAGLSLAIFAGLDPFKLKKISTARPLPLFAHSRAKHKSTIQE